MHAFPSVFPVSRWTSPQPGPEAKIPSCVVPTLVFKAFSLTSRKRQTDTQSVDLSWFECLTYEWSTDFRSLGSRRHWDSGGPEGTAAVSSPSPPKNPTGVSHERVIHPYAHLHWLGFPYLLSLNPFSSLKQGKCKRMYLLSTLSKWDLKPRSMGGGTCSPSWPL